MHSSLDLVSPLEKAGGQCVVCSGARSMILPLGTACYCVFCQVRSLGSHAAEAKLSGSRRRLDIFALDLLEEMTAIHGSIVWRQVNVMPRQFASLCSCCFWLCLVFGFASLCFALLRFGFASSLLCAVSSFFAFRFGRGSIENRIYPPITIAVILCVPLLRICQAEFLNHAVEVILKLYEGGEGARPVSSVLIVGHSLGGMVARLETQALLEWRSIS